MSGFGMRLGPADLGDPLRQDVGVHGASSDVDAQRDFGQAGVVNRVQVSVEAKPSEPERTAVHDRDRVAVDVKEGGAKPHGAEPKGEADGAAEYEGGDSGRGDDEPR